MSFSWKKITSTCGAVVCFCLANQAFAAYAMPQPEPSAMALGNWYVTGSAGAAFTPNIATKATGGLRLNYEGVGYDLGGAFGYRAGPMRFEGQYTFMRTNHDTLGGVNNNGNTTLHVGMANGYYDFQQLSDRFVPYLGVGVGFAHIKPTMLGITGSTNEFAYQGMAGVGFDVDNNFVVDLGYRYFATSKPDKFFTGDFSNHLLNLSVTYHIPA